MRPTYRSKRDPHREVANVLADAPRPSPLFSSLVAPGGFGFVTKLLRLGDNREALLSRYGTSRTVEGNVAGNAKSFLVYISKASLFQAVRCARPIYELDQKL